VVSTPLSDLTAAVRSVSAVDVAGLSAMDLVNGLEALLTVESQLRAVQARWLAAAEASDATVDECGRAPRSWLIEDQHLSAGEASRRMRVARGLSAYPQVQSAYDDGTITPEHVTTLLTALDQVPVAVRPAAEGSLVELAGAATPAQVAQQVDEVLTRLGAQPSAELQALQRHAARGVDLDADLGGTATLGGTLTPEAFETLRLALDAAAGPAGPDDRRTPRQRRHDGLGEIAAFYLHHADMPADRGERPRVVVTMSLETLLGQLDEHTATLGTDVPITAATARRLACDAGIIPAVLGGRSELLDLGRTTPVFSTAIRRAAWIRDGGHCVYPDCQRRIAELHHIRWRSRGGPTSLDNAAWLCAFHHWLVHEGHWDLRRDPTTGHCIFTDPTGRDRRQRLPRQEPRGNPPTQTVLINPDFARRPGADRSASGPVHAR
jgi:hypothetical protein